MLHHIDHMLRSAPAATAELVLRTVSRRGFLQGTAAGFALAAFYAPANALDRYPTGGDDMPHGLRYDPLLFVAIAPDGTVTITAHRSEMGQGARTSLPMVVADEMGADWERVKIVQAEGDEPKYGNQDTDGSRSMRHHIQSMRQIGASVRHMLARAAAEEWGVEPSTVRVGVHTVGAGDRQAGFGELAEAAMRQPIPAFEELSFKDESDFRYIGKGTVGIYDLHDITTGKAVYGADVSLPGMKYAVIARPPVVGGKAVSHDAAAAMAVPGVEAVVELAGTPPPMVFAPLGGIAVVAANTDAALKGRDVLAVEWDAGPNAGYDSAAFRAEMEKTAEAPGNVLRDHGNWDAASAAAARTVARTYYQAHMAHATMEPPAALASVTADRAEIWAPVQSPYGTRQMLAGALGLDEAAVTVHTTLLGGGFGRKSKCDYAIEAALLSREVGAPVRVQWTREDDIRHGFYHSTSIDRIEAAVDADGKVTGWLHRVVAPTIVSTFAEDPGYLAEWENGMGHVDLPFDVPAVRCENGKAMSHTRIGWWRSVNNVPRAFAIQSFVAELAEELGRDHKELLLELIGAPRQLDGPAMGMPDGFWNYGEKIEEYPIDTGRLANVLNVAADAAGYGQDLPEGEGIGLAVHRSFVTYVAAAARVKVAEDGTVRVPEVHMTVDCGFVVNPERIRSQMEGAAVMGMTLAQHSAITFEQGAVLESNFHDYAMVRSDNFPEKVTVHIVEHPFSVHASGAGEPGVPPIAPAIANAIFAATGKRLRDLPMGASL
jgi:isoquinoline 1-oxidoreductase subunit beta